MIKLGKEHILIVVGFLESFLYSGLLLGWATLNFLLKKEGVFSHLCSDTGQAVPDNTTKISPYYYINDYNTILNLNSDNRNDSRNETVDAIYLSCDEQSKILNLAYNISVTIGAFAGLVWGVILDKFGIKTLRLLMSFCISGGALCLMFTNKDYPYLLFPSLILCALLGISVRLSCLQIAELFPQQRSTLTALYSGANTASAAGFTLLKYFYDIGLNWMEMVAVFLGISFVALPFTFFFFSEQSFEQLKAQRKLKFESVEQLDEKPTTLKVQSRVDDKTLPLTFSIFSVNSLLYNFWFAWLTLYTLYYNGSLHLWVARTSNDPNDLNTYVDILGMSQLAAVILGPLTGILIDLQMRRVPKPEANAPMHPTCCGDGGDYDETRRQVKATFWMALLTTSLLGVIHVAKFFDTNGAIMTSIIFYILFRSSVMGVSITYVRQRFPLQHFNKLVGITATFRSIIFLFQFGLFVWDTDSPVQVNIFSAICLAAAFILPLHMKTPLLDVLMRREDKVANEIYQKTKEKADRISA